MRGGLLAMEIEDLLLAIRERDLRRVRRLVTRLPALTGATDRSGKPLAQHASECGDEEIAQLFREQGARARASPAEQHGDGDG